MQHEHIYKQVRRIIADCIIYDYLANRNQSNRNQTHSQCRKYRVRLIELRNRLFSIVQRMENVYLGLFVDRLQIALSFLPAVCAVPRVATCDGFSKKNRKTEKERETSNNIFFANKLMYAIWWLFSHCFQFLPFDSGSEMWRDSPRNSIAKILCTPRSLKHESMIVLPLEIDV